jgi:autotransporter strand-loop-strand O-heptosyltransferase
MSEIAISFHFVKGPYVELHGTGEEEYDVQFIDCRTTEVVFAAKLKPGQWARANRRWFTEWRVLVSRDGVVHLDHHFDCRGKRVYIALDSNCLGDNIAWIPYMREFARKHECQVIVSTFFNDLYKEQYPELTFVEPGETVSDLYAMYEVGCYSPWGGPRELNPSDYRTIPLQKVAADILGLDFVELHPKVSLAPAYTYGSNLMDGPYVCLSEHSTAGAKLWNYTGGWQRVVDFLKASGYQVVVISKEKTELRGVIDFTGGAPLRVLAQVLKQAKIYIGLASGLAWLAWAVNTPVILISGFSEVWAEFSTGIIRLQNQNVCHGCWNNTRFEFDKGDWNWCPNHKGTDRQFECSKVIPPEAVFAAISSIKKLDMKQQGFFLPC